MTGAFFVTFPWTSGTVQAGYVMGAFHSPGEMFGERVPVRLSQEPNGTVRVSRIDGLPSYTATVPRKLQRLEIGIGVYVWVETHGEQVPLLSWGPWTTGEASPGNTITIDFTI